MLRPHEWHRPNVSGERYRRRSAAAMCQRNRPSWLANRNAFSRSMASVPWSAMWNEYELRSPSLSCGLEADAAPRGRGPRGAPRGLSPGEGARVRAPAAAALLLPRAERLAVVAELLEHALALLEQALLEVGD